MQAGLATDHWKKSAEDYVRASKVLATSMGMHGFDTQYPVPIDPHGELLGGAHRVACALVVGCPVKVQRMQQAAWAPRWDRQWFVTNGMSAADLERLDEDWKALTA